MTWRDSRRALKQHTEPADKEDLTASATLHIAMIPIGGSDRETPGSQPVNWITALLRRAGIGGRFELKVPGGHAGQMLAVVDRITITLAWTIILTVTLAIATTSHLSAATTITILALELTGLVIILLATRGRRRANDRLKGN